MKIRDKVLIVEDEQNIKNFMSTILAANGFDTLMAGSAKEALSMISSHCPDLIILDLGLPDMDGMEVLKQVRAWSSVPVIVVSARTHEGDKVAALDLGADGRDLNGRGIQKNGRMLRGGLQCRLLFRFLREGRNGQRGQQAQGEQQAETTFFMVIFLSYNRSPLPQRGL